METRANTALIGAFTLIVLALGFVFIYWLARGSEQTNQAPLTVIFNDPVTGLSVGSQVVFNGINIGNVKTLELDPDNPSVVIAGLRVEPLRSIKTDTQVTLGFQGLTGVGYVELAGGSPNLPSIWEAMPDPTIMASRSSMQDLLAGARGILSRTDETLQSLERIVSENTDDISQAVADVRSFTGALAQNSERVAVLIDQAAGAAAGIADISARMQGLVQRSEALLAAVDPQEVGATLKSINTTAESLAAQSQRFGSIMQRADAITAEVQGFSQHLPALGSSTEALIAAIDPNKVAGTIDRLDAITAAVDPEQVRTTIAGVSSLAETLEANRENINTMVTRLTSLSNDLSAFAARLPVMGDQAATLLAAVDPAKLSQSIDDVGQFTTALAESSDDVEAIVADARGVSARFATLGSRAESLLTKLDSMAGEGGGGILEDAQATLAAVRDAANAFNSQVTVLGSGLTDFSDRGLREFQSLVSEGQRTISRLDRVISDIEQNPSGFLLGGETVPEYRGQRR
jgi:phospholipid/cholesterol/gamma-HCH transport system substrate-binding protein